jgi:hypothetical protein
MKPTQQKKKIVIRPFESKPKIPHNFEITSWNKLQEAINGVFHKRSIDMSKEELYHVGFPSPLSLSLCLSLTLLLSLFVSLSLSCLLCSFRRQIVEDLCIHKFGSFLYQKLLSEIEININYKVDSLKDQVTLPLFSSPRRLFTALRLQICLLSCFKWIMFGGTIGSKLSQSEISFSISTSLALSSLLPSLPLTPRPCLIGATLSQLQVVSQFGSLALPSSAKDWKRIMK